ncbi:Fbd-associated f-box protein [Thalictrum thalictroides]|uniref:Fbd-associated f-box protein n=1 Tax=Thalictrum thalictroides TaxID=46969 RepID=A0A7J6V299_THATH|nr:Fbd-associated f-box protein [Thalictrum thalictroides]
MEMNIDRISSLPEGVLHHILSFLDMKKVMQTSLLSSRWRLLWISLPHLNFSDQMWKHNKAGLVNFVDRVLLFRNNSDLHKFSLNSRNHYYEADYIGRWIISVVRKNVKEIHMQIYSDKSYELPSCLFASAVKVFTLKSYNYPIQLPTSICSSSNLKTLELMFSRFPKGNSKGELVLSFPVLENLILQFCDQKHLNLLTIYAIKLKNLVVKNGGRSAKLQLHSPNLTSFDYWGGNCGIYSMTNLSSLVTVNIWVHFRDEEVAQSESVRMLQMFNHTRSLVLKNSFPMCFFWQEQLASTFDNLRHLKLIRLCCCNYNLLESCPHIETLIWELPQPVVNCRTKGRGNECGAQISSECKFLHLKSVKIQNLEGCEHELKFIKYILRNGAVLENITITTKKALSSEREKELEEFSMKLQCLFKASSTVTILFLLKSTA